jgi:2-polyprenyl-6-hydroxyphenyl methylase/3-demethylubiquinone-9 3-methyltransferase
MASDRTVDADDVARFAQQAERWWDPAGPFAPLHKLNAIRIAFIRDRLASKLGRDPLSGRPLDGLRILDVGCGGGLLCEPMTRLGADVMGIDAAAENIAVAADHAATHGLTIDYRDDPVEAVATRGGQYDVVLNMEIVEHVADLAVFMDATGACVKPGGAMFVTTLNRTAKSFALAIVGAEYVLRWVPRGTHQWSKFVRPAELIGHLRRGGLHVDEVTGLVYSLLRDRWTLGRDLDVNYMLLATKPGADDKRLQA